MNQTATSSGSGSGGGITFITALTLLFIGLKLTGYIHWSWWWVLSPEWITFAFIFVLATFVTILKDH